MKRIKRKHKETSDFLGMFHTNKNAALYSLKNALLKERYEICSNIIAVAREFGASDREIRYLLEDPRRVPE